MRDRASNIQHPTSNIQHPRQTSGSGDGAQRRNYDLEERLLEFAARIVRLSNRLPKTRAGNHIAKQLLKAGTSPLPNHGEAQAAESTLDFRHKLKICLKELRESYRWLRLLGRVPLVKTPSDVQEVRLLMSESQELIRIFFVSIRTSQRKDQR